MAYTLSVPEAIAGDLMGHLSNIGEMEHTNECDYLETDQSHPRTCVGCWAEEAEIRLARQVAGISKATPHGVVPAAPRIRDPWRGR